MKAELIIEAMEMLLASGDHDDAKEREIKAAIKDTYEVLNNSTAKHEEWLSDVCLIPTNNCIDLLNVLHYDTYGKIRRRSMPRDPLMKFEFSQGVAQDAYAGFNDWPLHAIHAGFEFIEDLWATNEVEGYNKADGTFNKE